MDKSIYEIGEKLGITKKDIVEIKRAKIKEKLFSKLWLPLSGLISILIHLTGCISRESLTTTTTTITTTTTTTITTTTTSAGYPFAASLVPLASIISKKKRSRIKTLLISAAAFLLLLKATPVFGEAIKYNVYRKQTLST